jgi:hypothetical protein
MKRCLTEKAFRLDGENKDQNTCIIVIYRQNRIMHGVVIGNANVGWVLIFYEAFLILPLLNTKSIRKESSFFSWIYIICMWSHIFLISYWEIMEKPEQEIVYKLLKCYLCTEKENIFSKPSNLRKHLNDQHANVRHVFNVKRGKPKGNDSRLV